MKPQHFAVVSGLLVLLVLVLSLTGRPQAQDATADRFPQNLVTVIGEGEVRGKPNLVRITLGILSTDRASAAEAEALNLASAARVREALVAAGVDPEVLEVSQPTIEAVTDQDYAGAPRIAGFQAHTRMTGVLKYPGKVQAAIDSAIASGATSLDEVAYTLDDAEDRKQEALAKALANARLRAGALTRAGGEALGALISMEMLAEEDLPPATSPRGLVFKVRVKATFGF